MSFYKIKKIMASNFRNLEARALDLSSSINCIFGDNGNGKTNLLEIIHYLFEKKSFRKNTGFAQILSMDAEAPEIGIMALLEDDLSQYQCSAKIMGKETNWFFNGEKSKKKINGQIVFINPYDFYSFNNVPSERRDWFDNAFSKLDVLYKKNLSYYQKAIKQKNFLLGNKPNRFQEQVKALNSEIANYGKEIIEKRIELVKSLSPFISKIFKEIYAEEHELLIEIESDFQGLDKHEIFELLENNFEKECIIGKSNKGIHRDDYLLHFDGINSFEFCSLGQQKMSFLSLNFAYIELFRYKLSSYPIVLIDDVSGELDRRRWKNLVSFLEQRDFQVFITTANENFKKELKEIVGANLIYIENGMIKTIQ